MGNIPLFIGYAAVIVGIVIVVAGNREKLLERIRYRERDDER